MSDDVCLALKYFIQLKEEETTSWTNKLASDAGLCNFGLSTKSKMFSQLVSNTTVTSSRTSLVFWTQPTSIRVNGIEDRFLFDIYPNPNRGEFDLRITNLANSKM